LLLWLVVSIFCFFGEIIETLTQKLGYGITAQFGRIAFVSCDTNLTTDQVVLTVKPVLASQQSKQMKEI
jgi:hypothetical protein